MSAPSEPIILARGHAAGPTRRDSVKARSARFPLAKHALVLGMLTALGAFGIDAYLPAFPAIARSFGVGEGAVQASLVSYFIALAVGQVIYGPVSDRVGRRAPLLVGFGLFVLSSVGLAFAPSVAW